MITSVSYRKSGSPQPETSFLPLHTSAVTSNNVVLSSSTPPTRNNNTKAFGSFWQNLFRPKSELIPAQVLPVENGVQELTKTKATGDLERTTSSQSLNSICSTNSFSFVQSPKKYEGRKKGKRIPVDSSLPRPPQPNARRKLSTLTRLSMKIGLKSKYNLQSCESLHVLNTGTLNSLATSTNSIRKRRAPPPPVLISAVRRPSSSAGTPRLEEQVLPSTSEQAYGQRHRRCTSEGGFDYSKYISPKSRYHVRGKRKAPPPPNPFEGIPDDPEEEEGTGEESLSNSVVRLPIVAEEVRLRNTHPQLAKEGPGKNETPRNSYVEKQVQAETLIPAGTRGSNSLLNHEKYINDQVKAQLALLKSEADSSAFNQIIKRDQSDKIIVVVVGEKIPTGESRMETPSPTKCTPRPWYKRSTSKTASSSSSKEPAKPKMMILAKFSDLDREASRIVEEKKRKSAEMSYNESAKELTKLFKDFNINQQTVNVDVVNPPDSKGSTVQSPSTSPPIPQPISPGLTTKPEAGIGVPGKTPIPEEPKKLAVVQPLSNPRKSLTRWTENNSGASSISATAHANNVIPQSPLVSPALRKNESWSCPRCTLMNDYWRSFCDACHYRNTPGSTVQTISSLFENVKPAGVGERKVERSSTGTPSDSPSIADKESRERLIGTVGSISVAGNNVRRNDREVPPCENFLSQLPSKEKLAKEDKLTGMKLTPDPEIEELAIEKLREARVAFFEKKGVGNNNIGMSETKPNNLGITMNRSSSNQSNIKPGRKGNIPVSEDVVDDATLDKILEFHLQLNPNVSGSGPQTWKPLNLQKFQPILESIVESGPYHPLYENWNLVPGSIDGSNGEEAATNMFMQNVQTQLQDHIRYFEELANCHNNNSPEMGERPNQELTLEDYRKLGAVPKYYQSGSSSSGGDSASSRRSSDDSNMRANENPIYNQDTLAISKVLRKLEWAIAKGDHRLAASLAHDLAMFKANCALAKPPTQQITIRVYVEDRFMQQGPFQVQVTPNTTVKELKAKIECDWGIPLNFQKWILGRKIAEDDNHSLSSYDMRNDSMAFLYLVTPEMREAAGPNITSEPLPNKPETKPEESRKVKNSVNPNSFDEITQVLPTPMSNPLKTQIAKPSTPSNSTGEYAKVGVPQKTKEAELGRKSQEVVSEPILAVVKERNIQSKVEPTVQVQCYRGEIKVSSPTPVERTVDITTQGHPEPQSAEEKPGSPEYRMVKVPSKTQLKVVECVPTPIQPVAGCSKNINSNVKPSDIMNNNVLPKAVPLDNYSNKPPKSTRNNKCKPTESKEKETPLVLTPERVSRSRKVERTNVRKVDQGTSIERTAPILPENQIPKPNSESKDIPPKVTQKNVSETLMPATSKESKPPLPLPTPVVAVKEKIIEAPLPPLTLVPSISVTTKPELELKPDEPVSPKQSPPENSLPVITLVPVVVPIQSTSAVGKPSKNIQEVGPVVKPAPTSEASVSTPVNNPKQGNNIVEVRSLKKSPQMSREFVRSMGGLFMSRVSSLVAAVERNSRNPEGFLAGTNQAQRRISLNENILQSSSKASNLLGEKNVVKRRNSEAIVAGPSTGKVDVNVSNTHAPAGQFNTYKRMVELMEGQDLIRTSEDVECPICISVIPRGEGITLRDCLHSFCKECLVGAIQYSEEPQVRCPFRDNTYSCDCYLQEREVKGLAPAELYERHLSRSVKLAETKIRNAFHCKTNDCSGWCVFEDDVNVFNCPVCLKKNCLTCQAIHEGLNCQEFQRQLAIAAETDEDAKSSRLMLEKMISRGEALDCPACHVVLLKKWGCDWVRCSYCKTEICWITKGFRWGPNGKGDTSGGCKCGINGVRCHPKCTYCH